MYRCSSTNALTTKHLDGPRGILEWQRFFLYRLYELTNLCDSISVYFQKIPIEKIHTLFDDVLKEKTTVQEVNSSKLLKEIEDCVHKKRTAAWRKQSHSCTMVAVHGNG